MMSMCMAVCSVCLAARRMFSARDRSCRSREVTVWLSDSHCAPVRGPAIVAAVRLRRRLFPAGRVATLTGATTAM